MTNAFSTAQLINKDIAEGRLKVQESKPGSGEILKKIKQENIQVVKFEDWEKIDAEETKRGKEKGKPREKIVSVKEMLSVAA